MLRGVTSRAGISMRAKILASVLVFTAVVAAPGLAADMPRKAPPPMLFSWAGWYVGVNGGYGWADPSALITPADVPLQTLGTLDAAAPPFTLSTSPKGAVVGAQIGYNVQFDHLVAGAELDFDLAALKAKSTGNFTNQNTVEFVPVQVNGTASLTSRMNWFGTLRGRLGFTFDRLMPYITGGAAVAHVKSTVDVSGTYFNTGAGANTGAFGSSATVSDTRLGTAVGGGIDWAINPQWVVRGEYLFLHFQGNKNYGALIPGVTSLQNNMDAHIARVALNYRFGF
jgi:outer membrane immunogenic protein